MYGAKGDQREKSCRSALSLLLLARHRRRSPIDSTEREREREPTGAVIVGSPVAREAAARARFAGGFFESISVRSKVGRTGDASMATEVELEFDKYCIVGRSPRTVLPSLRHCSKIEHESKKECPCSKNDQLSLEGGLTEIKFCNYRSVSCKSLPSRNLRPEGKEVLKRGSVYESSKERNLKRSEIDRERRKIEFSLGSDSSFSFSILDSICGSDEEGDPLEEKRASVMTSPYSNTTCSSKSSQESSSTDCLHPYLHVPKDRSLEISLNFGNRKNSSSMYTVRDSKENDKLKCDQVTNPSDNSNVLKERDTFASNQPDSPANPEINFSSGSSKSRFSPIRRVFDPLTKSKSHRSSLSFGAGEMSLSGNQSIRRSKTLRKSLLNDFSSTIQNVESSCQSVKEEQQEQQIVSSRCSPAHLHGDLKLVQKHGMPYFEFSLMHAEDVFVAKMWKAEDKLDWVYTFHSVKGRKKSTVSGWGLKYCNKDSPMVAQMQVSCYVCSELKEDRVFSNFMVMEFVLYDIAHSRKSVATAEEEPGSTDVAKDRILKRGSAAGTVELDDLFDPSRPKSLMPRSRAHASLNYSTPYPWAAMDLHPSLENAAIVIQIPIENRESLKCRRGNKVDDQMRSSLLELSLAEQTMLGISDDIGTVKVNVVTPLGSHGLPSGGSKGPSPLLDRWRLGGGCDCGGWDMACPLVVFGNPKIQCKEEHSLLGNQWPLELFGQGAKEKAPVLRIAITEKGNYSVDFHAQLSSLQALAICVAVLHTTEASVTLEQEKNKHLLQNCSLKDLVEDEVKVLFKAATEEGMRQVKKQPSKENPPPFALNPPFSPIARIAHFLHMRSDIE
ncbi:hypothetical protein Nepgr_011232 [Nepenthes gracilis]|uniref:Uncharacterized protein n=1 Tax=Nepenthes gracilis TaxID=150966 RepID=A0AAD3XM73_NEPGR|nr:hypothetical protein Nepgr_011232 [Nepenthes gracilis]